MKIEVIDKDGWQKAFSLEKTLFHIGSAAMNDLILDARRGAGVSARHAQLIALPDSAGYRLVNLGEASILLGENDKKATPIPPHNVGIVANGSVMKIGDYTLIFHGETVISSPSLATSEHSGRSSHMGLRLSIPYTTLAPHQTLVGKLFIANHGDRTGVQFDLELEGIENESYRIEPAPLLSSGAESEIAIRFYHRGSKPLAGAHTVVIRAFAPQAYPGEEASVTCALQVQPFFQHTLRPASLGLPAQPRQTQTVQTQTAQTRPVQTQPVQTQDAQAWEQELLPPVIPTQRAPTQRPQPVRLSAPSPPVASEPAPRTPNPPSEDWWSIPEKATTAIPVAIALQEEPEPEMTQSTVALPETVAALPKTVAPPPETVAPPPETVAAPPEAVAAPPEAVAPPPETVAPPPETVAALPETVAALPETETVEAAIIPAHSPIELPTTPTLPPLVESAAPPASDAAISEVLREKVLKEEVLESETAETETPLPTTEPPPGRETIAAPPAPNADEWWSVPEPPVTEKPEVLMLKATPATAERAPEDETDTEKIPAWVDNDWWSEP